MEFSGNGAKPTLRAWESPSAITYSILDAAGRMDYSKDRRILQQRLARRRR